MKMKANEAMKRIREILATTKGQASDDELHELADFLIEEADAIRMIFQ
jgi:hypothetical protein